MCDSFSIIWLKAVSIIKREGDNDDANPKDATIAWIGSAPAASDNTNLLRLLEVPDKL